jgi:thiosulfate/3-mercaptopyruvate sulfurtransferase
MRTHRSAGAALTLLLIAGAHAPAVAQNPRDRLLITVDQLARNLTSADLVLLHVGQEAEYRAEHIPGARLITMDDLSLPHPPSHDEGLMLELPPAAELRTKLEQYGISDNSRIVVYYGNDWISPATRILFTLDYAGLGDRSALLDGGMRAWKAAGKAVTAEVPRGAQGRLSARPVEDVVFTAEQVEQRLKQPGFAIIDARTPVFYSGREAGMSARAGHIPGARNIPFTELAGDDLHIRDNAALRALFDGAGVRPDDTIIVYCHIGQQATTIVYAARLLGRNVKLYDGSFTGWTQDADRPVETGEAREDAPLDRTVPGGR